MKSEIVVECKYGKDRYIDKVYTKRCVFIDKLPIKFCNTIFCFGPTNVTWTFYLINKKHLVEIK